LELEILGFATITSLYSLAAQFDYTSTHTDTGVKIISLVLSLNKKFSYGK